MSDKQFNNSHGTTSSEFAIGVGAANIRHIGLTAICQAANANATDRDNNQLTVDGVEFFDMKVIAQDQIGNVLTKQLRGTIVVGGNITLIEDVFEEGFNGDVTMSLTGNTLSIVCHVGTAITASYNVYITLQRIV
jgi:hypothetical protein